MIGTITDERIAEILKQASDAYEGAGEAVIMRLPEYDADATRAAYSETEDLYVLTDGTVIDGEGDGWKARRPAPITDTANVTAYKRGDRIRYTGTGRYTTPGATGTVVGTRDFRGDATVIAQMDSDLTPRDKGLIRKYYATAIEPAPGTSDATLDGCPVCSGTYQYSNPGEYGVLLRGCPVHVLPSDEGGWLAPER